MYVYVAVYTHAKYYRSAFFAILTPTESHCMSIDTMCVGSHVISVHFNGYGYNDKWLRGANKCTSSWLLDWRTLAQAKIEKLLKKCLHWSDSHVGINKNIFFVLLRIYFWQINENYYVLLSNINTHCICRKWKKKNVSTFRLIWKPVKRSSLTLSTATHFWHINNGLLWQFKD